MAYDAYGLTELVRTERRTSRSMRFSEGDVRQAFKQVFSHGKDYVLFQTVANPQAVQELEKYIGFCAEMGAPWTIREIQPGDHPRYVPGATSHGNGLRFDNSLMDSYLGAIDKTAKEAIGEKNFAHYSMVSTEGINSADRDCLAVSWPRIYLVSAEKEASLKEIIDGLSGDESFEVLKKQEAPQFYQMGEIETLHKLNIPPLIRLDRELRMNSRELAGYVDFLAQMREVQDYLRSGPYDDG